jgi:hypothetical protein
MPCRSYEQDDDSGLKDLKDLNDKLAQIACKALQHIEDTNDGAEFLLLKDPEVADWWKAHKEADLKEQRRKEKIRAAKEEKTRLEAIKQSVLSRLTEDELKALGVK